MAEHPAVNRRVVGSSPTSGAQLRHRVCRVARRRVSGFCPNLRWDTPHGGAATLPFVLIHPAILIVAI
jgi:hypothetical protein